ncbi:MAG: DUF2520 domain-containing protein [bacterium]|nr:DUF2520 domain-containing protein [bacterium]
MRLVLVGPGRAGMSLAIAAVAAGHEVVAVVGRSAESAQRGASLVAASALTIGEDLPEADLLIIATRDGVIEGVAERLAESDLQIPAAVHLSGLSAISALDPLAAQGLDTGSFHPLQTLPTPEAGSARLRGAYVAITAAPALRSRLEDFARSLGSMPFALDDSQKPLYHAAAAAAANFPLVALAMASDLFASAGVPWEAARPLVEAVVANVFELGPRAALTGPVARGDIGTVAAQLHAVASSNPEWQVAFARFIESLAALTGRSEQFESVLNNEEP